MKSRSTRGSRQRKAIRTPYVRTWLDRAVEDKAPVRKYRAHDDARLLNMPAQEYLARRTVRWS